MQAKDPPTPRPAFEPAAVRVDIHGLLDFARLLQAELETNFRPTVAQIATEHSYGVHFGETNPSKDVQRARDQYGVCLRSAIENTQEYLSSLEILITAIRKIAATYRDVDHLAAARATAIDDAIYEAQIESLVAQQSAVAQARAARQLERQRRLERMGIYD